MTKRMRPSKREAYRLSKNLKITKEIPVTHWGALARSEEMTVRSGLDAFHILEEEAAKFSADWNYPLFIAFPSHTHRAVVQVDAISGKRKRIRNPKAGVQNQKRDDMRSTRCRFCGLRMDEHLDILCTERSG
jgi:hypothetical protein